MNKKFFIVGAFITFVLCIILYFTIFNKREKIEIRYVNKYYNAEQDPTVDAEWDQNGKIVFDKSEEGKDSIPMINSKLNGKVFYRFRKNDLPLIKTEVFKYDYRKADFSIGFNNDTLTTSTPFQVTIVYPFYDDKNFSFKITDGNTYKIVRENITANQIKFIYKREKQKKGLNTFKGILLANGDRYQIEFNFYVKN